MSAGIIGLVPIRGFGSGKSRLAGAFSATERAAISRWMLDGVISAALAVDSLTELAVISPDSAALAYARSLDQRVTPILQRDDRPGLNPAVRVGRDWAAQRGATGLLVIFGDLPLLMPLDVRTVLETPAQVVVATDRHGTGTNLSLVRFAGGGTEFVYRYGAGSAQRHEAEAARLGLSFATVISPGAAFDLDTPDDWHALVIDRDVARGERLREDPPFAVAVGTPFGERAS